jgi:hypothetical protein
LTSRTLQYRFRNSNPLLIRRRGLEPTVQQIRRGRLIVITHRRALEPLAVRAFPTAPSRSLSPDSACPRSSQRDNYASGWKANRLRGFWSGEEDCKQALA